MAIGIYIALSQKNVNQGDTVAICLPTPLMLCALSRGYLGKGLYCSGTMPLIKKVVAKPGDLVELSENKIKVGGKVYSVKFYNYDSSGRVLNRIMSGKYKSSGYWVLGTNSDRSWDSRYFGELPRESILCTLKPILTW